MPAIDMEKALKDITKICANHAAIAAVYLYGSWAEQRAMVNSDLDLGVLLRPSLSKHSMWQTEDELYFELSGIWKGEVDVRVINTAPLAAQYEIITYGKTIFISNLEVTADFESQISRKYWDFKKIQDEYDHYYLKRYKEALGEAELREYQDTLRKIKSVHRRVREKTKTKPQ